MWDDAKLPRHTVQSLMISTCEDLQEIHTKPSTQKEDILVVWLLTLVHILYIIHFNFKVTVSPQVVTHSDFPLCSNSEVKVSQGV